MGQRHTGFTLKELVAPPCDLAVGLRSQLEDRVGTIRRLPDRRIGLPVKLFGGAIDQHLVVEIGDVHLDAVGTELFGTLAQ